MKRQAETSERSTPQKKARAKEGLERLSETQKQAPVQAKHLVFLTNGLQYSKNHFYEMIFLRPFLIPRLSNEDKKCEVNKSEDTVYRNSDK